jgi:hypothetical protein
MMIGPSAPKGLPVPMEMAEDIGLRMETLRPMRLCSRRIASSASGIPCPRIFSDPDRAMAPMISPPATGTATNHHPR